MKALISFGIAAAVALTTGASAQTRSPQIGIVRLDCGNATVKNFNAFFSDTNEYPAGPGSLPTAATSSAMAANICCGTPASPPR